MSEQAENQDLDMVRKHAEALIEHFDTVQIFCTRHDMARENGTIQVQFGKGNWFARYGHVKDWINREENATRRKDDQEDDDE